MRKMLKANKIDTAKTPMNGGKKASSSSLLDAPASMPFLVGGQAPITPQGVVALREEDQKIIREFDLELHKAKMDLANLTVQIEMLTAQKQQLVQKLLDTDRGFFERIKKAATEYGLDLDKEKWNFDAGKMVFSKVP